ncbi:MAG: dependent oxidoreductase [Cyanobacteria bacterium RYN_339]|nr:dependent oxidoreductase [Cyanobacteria bacterium RYN_339]
MAVMNPDRRGQLAALLDSPPDLLVVGGGVVGAGIAWEAALRGLRVAVLEKHDFASGTSSKSSKLLHGGLRYLEQFEFHLVFESLAERNRLFHDAPHVAKRLPFLFPMFKGGRDKGWKVGLGLFVYDMLATLSNKRPIWHDHLKPAKAVAAEPSLSGEGLLGAYRYTDGLTEDARLVIETLKSAAAAGAIALNHVGVEAFTKDTSGHITGVRARDALSGETFDLGAKIVFNACGPWADGLCRLDDPAARPRLRPTKGVHVITETFVSDHAVVMRSPLKDGRILFVVPWQGRTLIGTTDTDHHGPAGDDSYLDHDVEASPEEVRYLLDAVNASFTVKLQPTDVISAFAGWRPLIAPPEAGVSEGNISREHEIFRSTSGLITIAGGKLTGYRTMARQAVDAVIEALGVPAGPTRIEHAILSGSELDDLDAYVDAAVKGSPELDPTLVRALAARHGSHWPTVKAMLTPDLTRSIGTLGNYLVEAAYAVRHEAAVTLADFLARRTRLYLLDANQGLDFAEDSARAMARELATSETWVQQELASYRGMVAKSRATRLPGEEPRQVG